MSTRDALAAVGATSAPNGAAVRAVEAVTGWLEKRTSRRGFLIRAGVVGSALAVDPSGYVLKPGTAYASVCGPGASCTSGWTVFCATINHGSNSCPPGSIAAGWWKADGASLCGGKARYIVDCNATCHCTTRGSRPGICAPSCQSCSCTCGPSGQCDQRRVCCTQFRYGQCNEQVRQVGAVHCRVVSCTPPWRWANCSTSPATDNATVHHSAPLLPSAYTPLTVRYIALGENGSRLGATIGPELAVPGGRAQRYQHGRMSRAGTGSPHITTGAIAVRYVQLGGEAGGLGFPLSDPITIAGGKASPFQHGRMSQAGSAPPHYTYGGIATRYVQLGGETGGLGFPTADPRSIAGGRASSFQHGRLSWSAATGVHHTTGSITVRLGALGYEAGVLGFPTTDPVAVAGGHCSRFQHGRISSSAAGTWEVLGLLDAAYGRSGGEAGLLGFPVAASRLLSGSRNVSTFQRGRICASSTAAHWVRGPIADRYVTRGAEDGPFGLPTTDETHPTPSVRRSEFVGGWIEYDETTQTVTEGPPLTGTSPASPAAATVTAPPP